MALLLRGEGLVFLHAMAEVEVRFIEPYPESDPIWNVGDRIWIEDYTAQILRARDIVVIEKERAVAGPKETR